MTFGYRQKERDIQLSYSTQYVPSTSFPPNPIHPIPTFQLYLISYILCPLSCLNILRSIPCQNLCHVLKFQQQFFYNLPRKYFLIFKWLQWGQFLGRCPYTLFPLLGNPHCSTPGYIHLYISTLHIPLHVASLHIHHSFTLSTLLGYHLAKPLSFPQEIHEYPRTICLPSRQLHCPFSYRDQGNIENVLPLLSVSCLCTLGLTWSTKPI